MPELTLTEAMRRANRVRDDSMAHRDRQRGFWTLAYCYAYGHQWGYQRGPASYITAERLRIITDPGHPGVRVYVNHIRPAIQWLRSKLAPKRIDANLIPADGSMRSRVVKFAGDELLKKHMDRIGAVDIYRRINEMRLVMGTGIIRRTISTAARRTSPGGKPLRDFRCGWMPVFPHEVIRDPSAATTRPGQDETVYGFERPMPLAKARMMFPGVQIEEQPCQLGQLMEYQAEIQGAGGQPRDSQAMLSTEPGIVVYEFFFTDEAKGPGWHWYVPMYSFHAPPGNQAKLQPLMTPEQISADKPLPNPFQAPTIAEDERLAWLGLPFHHFNYEPEIMAPWGSGVPHILMAGQDLFNMGITWYARMQAQGGGKIVVEDGTVERPNRQFNNRVDMVIRYRPRTNKSVQPYRLEGPGLTQASTAFVDRAPGWIEQALNRTRVQVGETSKRGESGQAVTAKLEAAGAPLEDIQAEDERRLGELCWATFLDLANPKTLRISQARRIAGPAVPEEHLMALLQDHPAKTTRGVRVLPGTLRPKTPEQEQEEFVALAGQGILDATDVQRELANRGVAINTRMAKNIEKQTTELDAMIHGEESDLAVDDDHDTHLYVISLLVGSPQWLALDEEIQERIETHSALHRQTALEVSQVDAQLLAASQTPPQPSPPGEAFAPGGRQMGAVTPAY